MILRDFHSARGLRDLGRFVAGRDVIFGVSFAMGQLEREALKGGGSAFSFARIYGIR